MHRNLALSSLFTFRTRKYTDVLLPTTGNTMAHVAGGTLLENQVETFIVLFEFPARFEIMGGQIPQWILYTVVDLQGRLKVGNYYLFCGML
ncbi:hypothetical protein WN51_06139 [Melipona quadrifasciata]|uniref:Uncharacterized protein n=1 Tax=Melipona quadrifasciata TaxID=166423 RepID=A0A0M8ZP59_9HYME|nr:hypothetical protein WN51_06139 [Melipona quadrifasciata]